MEPGMSKDEMRHEDGHIDRTDEAWQDLERIHAVYTDMLEALVASCKKHRVHMTLHDFEVAMEGIGESLADEADWSLQFIESETYIPSNSKQLIAAAHERLVDEFRIKPIDWSATLTDILRPIAQNPRTHADKGDPV